LRNSVVVITGANSGIGFETAKTIARLGATVVLACRSKERAEAAAKKIKEESGNDNIIFIQLDLCSMQSIREFAKKFREHNLRLDVLVNNAGIFWIPAIFGRQSTTLTKDGINMQFMSNCVGPWMLTNELLDELEASGGRIVNVSSSVHFFKSLDTNDVEAKLRDHIVGYANSKLCELYTSYEMDRRLRAKKSKVTINSLHPGIVATEISSNDLGFAFLRILARFVIEFLAKTAEQGAATSIYAICSPDLEGVSGKYLSDCRIKQSSAVSHDEKLSRFVWDYCEKLVHQKYPISK